MPLSVIVIIAADVLPLLLVVQATAIHVFL